jgi:hypothetical protein
MGMDVYANGMAIACKARRVLYAADGAPDTPRCAHPLSQYGDGQRHDGR